jgi:hypothetical protein
MTFGGKDNRGPSIAELQRYIREHSEMAFMLNTGKEVVGVLRWFDEHAFSIVPKGEQPFTILRSAVVGYRKVGGGGAEAPVAAPPATQTNKSEPPAAVSSSAPDPQPEPNSDQTAQS